MKRRFFLTGLLLMFGTGAVLAQATVAITGKQIRGVPGRNAELISKGVMLPKGGTITRVDCGGDGFWIEDDKGVVNEWRVAAQGVGAPLDPGGPYRAYPFLKNGQAQTSVTLTVSVP